MTAAWRAAGGSQGSFRTLYLHKQELDWHLRYSCAAVATDVDLDELQASQPRPWDFAVDDLSTVVLGVATGSGVHERTVWRWIAEARRSGSAPGRLTPRHCSV